MAAPAKQVQTRQMGSFNMASAADRSLQFKTDNPNSKIATERERDDDGLLVFKAYVWKDKKDYLELAKIPGLDIKVVLSSADAEGTAKQAEGKTAKKDFEKLETIAVGRALAFLGYLKDGQVASSEEMENYYAYKEELIENEADTAMEYLRESENLDDLKKRWVTIGGEVQQIDRVEKLKNDLKLEFEVKIVEERKAAEKAKKDKK